MMAAWTLLLLLQGVSPPRLTGPPLIQVMHLQLFLSCVRHRCEVSTECVLPFVLHVNRAE